MPGDPVLVKLEVPPGGLGLSLEPIQIGTDRRSVVVVDIKSTSKADLTIGDEILEVFG